MPKYKKYTGEVKEHPEWVINGLDPIIVDGKKLKNGGWERIADLDGDAQKVLDSTKPLDKAEKSAKAAEAKSSLEAATDTIDKIAGFVEAEELDTAKEFLEAAEAAIDYADECAQASEQKGVAKLVVKAKEAYAVAMSAYTEAAKETEEDDLVGDLKQ